MSSVEQLDSATLLLKSSKSLLQIHETENYCKQTWETKSDISKYWAICVLKISVASWKLKLTWIFLFKLFRYMTKRSRKKLKYLENEKCFRSEIKAFFIIFKELSVAKNFLRPESAPLMLRFLLNFWV